MHVKYFVYAQRIIYNRDRPCNTSQHWLLPSQGQQLRSQGEVVHDADTMQPTGTRTDKYVNWQLSHSWQQLWLRTNMSEVLHVQYSTTTMVFQKRVNQMNYASTASCWKATVTDNKGLAILNHFHSRVHSPFSSVGLEGPGTCLAAISLTTTSQQHSD